MGRSLTLILGGARSGKSALALKLAAEKRSKVLYVATAEPGDAEMARRIARHRAERPLEWTTLEAPRSAARAIRAAQASCDVLILDCLTLLAANVLAGLPETAADAAETALLGEVEDLLAVYAAGTADWIVVSNEVGLGIVPIHPLGRAYRDALGRANQRLAAAANTVLFLVAGMPLRAK